MSSSWMAIARDAAGEIVEAAEADRVRALGAVARGRERWLEAAEEGLLAYRAATRRLLEDAAADPGGGRRLTRAQAAPALALQAAAAEAAEDLPECPSRGDSDAPELELADVLAQINEVRKRARAAAAADLFGPDVRELGEFPGCGGECPAAGDTDADASAARAAALSLVRPEWLFEDGRAEVAAYRLSAALGFPLMFVVAPWRETCRLTNLAGPGERARDGVSGAPEGSAPRCSPPARDRIRSRVGQFIEGRADARLRHRDAADAADAAGAAAAAGGAPQRELRRAEMTLAVARDFHAVYESGARCGTGYIRALAARLALADGRYTFAGVNILAAINDRAARAELARFRLDTAADPMGGSAGTRPEARFEYECSKLQLLYSVFDADAESMLGSALGSALGSGLGSGL